MSVGHDSQVRSTKDSTYVPRDGVLLEVEDLHVEFRTHDGVAKLVATRTAVHAALQAIQICGVRGCLETAPFGRYLRDAKTYEIAGGSSEVLKNTLGDYLVAAVDGPG